MRTIATSRFKLSHGAPEPPESAQQTIPTHNELSLPDHGPIQE
jgi:hypothetical protein